MKPRTTSINPRQSSIQQPGSRDRRPLSDRVKRSVGRDITKKQKEPSEKKKQMAHAREKKKKQMAHAREQKQRNKNCQPAAAEGPCVRAEGSSVAFDIATAALANAVAAAKIESNAAEIYSRSLKIKLLQGDNYCRAKGDANEKKIVAITKELTKAVKELADVTAELEVHKQNGSRMREIVKTEAATSAAMSAELKQVKTEAEFTTQKLDASYHMVKEVKSQATVAAAVAEENITKLSEQVVQLKYTASAAVSIPCATLP